MLLAISQKFTGKHLCQSLFFNKVAGLRPATLLKRNSVCYRCFPMNFCEISKSTLFYRTPLDDCFFTEYVWKILFFRNRFYLNSRSYSEINSLCSNKWSYINHDISTISLNDYGLHHLLKWTTRKVIRGWKALNNGIVEKKDPVPRPLGPLGPLWSLGPTGLLDPPGTHSSLRNFLEFPDVICEKDFSRITISFVYLRGYNSKLSLQ